MYFNSFLFVGFFAIVYGAYLVLPWRWQNRMLLGASYLFYGCWDWRFLSLIILSTVVDFWCGKRIADSQDEAVRKRCLWISVCTNLGLLAFFKYANFFVDSFVGLSESLGLPIHLQLARIVVPVGISFYTFQTLSYTIDIYRGRCSPVRNFWDFALFVAYFPQLVAGPIERASVLLPQLTKARRLRSDQLEQGCQLILSGYFLKVVVADNLAPFAERVFANPDGETGLVVLIATYAAAFQIYGDFAGYTNIARGISKLMGIDLMKNFDRPYFAISPSDFWKRWHISLSSWLRDYLYIPLGGNRGSTWMTYRNLMLTMVIGGLWHGAAWHFVVWGFFHGAILCLWRLAGWERDENRDTKFSVSRMFKVILFFHVTCIGWVLFFVQDIRDLPTLLQNFLDFRVNGMIGAVSLVVFAGPLMLSEYFVERRKRQGIDRPWSVPVRATTYGLMTLAICFAGRIDSNAFIYFQF